MNSNKKENIDVVDKFIQGRKEVASKYLEIIESMLDDYDRYCFAESTLVDIYDFITENGYITLKQIQSVKNIKQSVK